MKYVFTAIVVLGSFISACTDRNRVGHQGNTGDGGVESTATKHDSTLRDTFRRDTTGRMDTTRH